MALCLTRTDKKGKNKITFKSGSEVVEFTINKVNINNFVPDYKINVDHKKLSSENGLSFIINESIVYITFKPKFSYLSFVIIEAEKHVSILRSELIE